MFVGAKTALSAFLGYMVDVLWSTIITVPVMIALGVEAHVAVATNMLV
jgi:hypothetical protein